MALIFFGSVPSRATPIRYESLPFSIIRKLCSPNEIKTDTRLSDDLVHEQIDRPFVRFRMQQRTDPSPQLDVFVLYRVVAVWVQRQNERRTLQRVGHVEFR